MAKVLSDCTDFSEVYIDDIVFSANLSQHVTHLRAVLKALSSYGLTVNITKCSFGKTHINYLSHLVGNGSLAVPEARITHLAQYHLPKTKRDLKSFLGLVSYYRRFIPNLADSTAALTSATVARAPNEVEWTSARLEAFYLIRKSLCCHTYLTNYSCLV